MLNQPGEILVILIIILLLFGPKKLPELARALGQSVKEFRKAAQGIVEEPPPPKTVQQDQEKKEATES